MSPGRNVRLYLVDGAMTGIVTAEIMNWTGHLLMAPRGSMGEALRRPEVTKTGVYFLVGEDPDQPTKKKVYVGEGDDISLRIKAHDKSEAKDFWTTACFVTSKDSNLTKAHVRYLEGRLIQLVRSSGRANLANGTEPEAKILPESDIADMEYFLDQLQLVMPALGFDFLRVQHKSSMLVDVPSPAGVETRIELELAVAKYGLKASATAVGDELIVLANSTALTEEFAVNTYRLLRQQLIEESLLVPLNGTSLLEFREDVVFSSPSAAAAVIFNRNTNGRTAWRLKGTQQTLKDWQDSQLGT